MTFQLRPLGELCLPSVETIDPKRNPEREFWYIDISAVDNMQKRIATPQRVIGKSASVRAKQVVRTGDVIVATTRPNLNSVALVPSEYDGQIASTGFCVLRPGSDLDADYLFSFVCSSAFVDPLTDLTKGALYPAVTDKQVVAQVIPWLPLDEQRCIAARLKAQLSEANRARHACTAQLEGAGSLLAAIYREAFEHAVPVAVPPIHDDTPPGWQWRKLTEVAQLESGHTPSRSRPDWWGGDVSWLSLTEIRALDGQWVESTQLRTNAAGIANSAARILPRGTVCYSRTASVGFVAIMAKPMATSQDFANWVCGDGLDPEFLMHALIRARKELRDLATGATHKTIYMPTLESFHICAPDLDIQRRIVRELKQRLAEVSGLRASLAAQQAELTKLPQRLLAQAFEN